MYTPVLVDNRLSSMCSISIKYILLSGSTLYPEHYTPVFWEQLNALQITMPSR